MRQPATTSFGETLRRMHEKRAGEVAVEETPFIDWALMVPEPKAGRLDWGRFPFQVELYGEGAAEREAVVMKATQVGVSAFLLRWALYWADRRYTSLYVFPRRKQMYDFSDARVDAAISRSPYLASRVRQAAPDGAKKVDNKGVKRVGQGWVYFRGSESEDDLDAVDADALCMDEYDRLNPANIPVAERRVSGEASLGLIRRVGIPTIPNFGLARLYARSDRRRWLVRCRCGDEQPMTWKENVCLERRLRVCRSCRQELRPQDVAAGRWVPEAPDVDVRGYHLPKFVLPTVNMGALIDNSEATLPEERQAFWNRDMAEPYAPEEGRLSPEAIAAATRPDIRLQEGYAGDGIVTMGVDVADVRALNVRISELLPDGRKRALWIGRPSSFNDLPSLMDRFRVSMCVIDAAPNYRLSMGLAERYPGRVYLVRYAQQEQAFAVKEDIREVRVRRVEAIDATFDAVRGQRNLLPEALPPGYAEQMSNLVRVVEKDAAGRKVVRYMSTGPDDYAHAEVFDMVAGLAWRVRTTADEAARERITTIEDHMEFERSALNLEDDYYDAGPGEGEYAMGGGSGYADPSDW